MRSDFLKFEWGALPHDDVFKKGNQIEIIIAGCSYQRTIPSTTGETFEVHLGKRHINLPILEE